MTRKQYIEANVGEVRYNSKGHILVLGCNYHLTWQREKKMRFVLDEISKGKATMITRMSKRRFFTNIDDLIFIGSVHNKRKAKEMLGIDKYLRFHIPNERETLQNEAEQAAMENNNELEQT
jgi:hypothetical protein